MSDPSNEKKRFGESKPIRLSAIRGLGCCVCGCCDLRVVYTRKMLGGKLVRRRQCRNCGWRMLTYEREEE